MSRTGPYTGNVDLINGLRRKNNGDFFLVDSPDVRTGDGISLQNSLEDMIKINDEAEAATKINITTTNEDIDLITTQDFENIIAEEFLTNKTYAIGQYVLYEGDLYKFITIHNEGDWDNSQVVLVKINSEIANINSQVGELKIQFNKVVKWEETILTNHGRGAWINDNNVIKYVSAQSGSNYALVPYAVNSGDMIQVVSNNPYIKAVFFVNENEGNYELISANTYSGNGKRDYNETFIIESGVSHILINKYGSGTVSCKNLVAKTDKALSTANIPADAQITGLKFAEILAILKN